MSRPEGTQAPELFYNENEAQKYDTNSRMRTIQVTSSFFTSFSLDFFLYFFVVDFLFKL